MSSIRPLTRALIRPERGSGPEEYPHNYLPLYTTLRTARHEPHVDSQLLKALHYLGALLRQPLIVASPLPDLGAQHYIQQTELSQSRYLQSLEKPRDSIRPTLPSSRNVRTTSDKTKPIVKPSNNQNNSPGECYAHSRHNRRIEELSKCLDSILPTDGSDMCTILMCWGKSTSCTAFPVRVPTTASDVEHWTRIQQSWYQHRGFWRKYIPMLCVKGVEEVKLSILQRLEVRRGRKPFSEYSGIYDFLDDTEEKSLARIVNNYEPFHYHYSDGHVEVDDCSYRVIDEKIFHCIKCIQSNRDRDNYNCGFDDFNKAQRRLLRVRLQSSLFLNAFLDPNTTGLNAIDLGGQLIISHADVMRKIKKWHNPSLYELEFHALLIREGWALDSRRGVIFLLYAVVLCTFIIGAYLLYGDWGTAWTAGGVLVSCIAFAQAWTRVTSK